eukprot:5336087-Pleurochrysis_carterae.AAC.1
MRALFLPFNRPGGKHIHSREGTSTALQQSSFRRNKARVPRAPMLRWLAGEMWVNGPTSLLGP